MFVLLVVVEVMLMLICRDITLIIYIVLFNKINKLINLIGTRKLVFDSFAREFYCFYHKKKL